jgi:hypothetical protein
MFRVPASCVSRLRQSVCMEMFYKPSAQRPTILFRCSSSKATLPPPDFYQKFIKNPPPDALEREAQLLEARAYYLRQRPHLLKTNPFQWAAVSKDRVIVTGESMTDVLEKLDNLEKSGQSVPPSIILMIGMEDQKPAPLATNIFSSVFKSLITSKPTNAESAPLATGLDILPPVPGELQPQTVWNNWYPRFSYFLRPYLTLGVKVHPKDTNIFPVTFLLDTGSSRTYIGSEIIKKLGLVDSRQDNRLDVPEGQGWSTYIEGVHVIVQESEGHDNMVVKDEMGKVIGVLNVVGTDLLRDRKLSIDWKSKDIQWK